MHTVLNMHWKPSKFANLPQKEKAYVVACIQLKNEKEDREQKRIKKPRRR